MAGCCNNSTKLPGNNIPVPGPPGPPGADGPPGPTGPSGTSDVGQTIFVDQTTGDDATGLRERFDKMFATYNAAKAVALPGDTIIMYPGNYTITQMQFAGGKVYAYPGVILNGRQLITDNGLTSADTFELTGHAVLMGIANFLGDAEMILFSGAGNVNIECDKMISTQNRALIQYNKLSEEVRIRANYMMAVVGVTLRSNGGSPNARIIVDCIHFDNQNSVNVSGAIIQNTLFLGNVLVRAQLITASTNVGAGNWFSHQNVGVCNVTVICDTFICNNSNNVFLFQGTGANIYFEAKRFISGAGVILYSDFDGSVSNSKVTFNCEEVITTGRLVHLNTMYNITMKGTMTSSYAAEIGYLNNGNLTIEGPIKNTVGYGLLHSAGNLTIKNRVETSNALPANHTITKIGGTLILDNAKLIVADPAAFSINATTNQDIKVYSAFTNNNTGGGGIITNLITGTSIIVDSDVS